MRDPREMQLGAPGRGEVLAAGTMQQRDPESSRDRVSIVAVDVEEQVSTQ